MISQTSQLMKMAGASGMSRSELNVFSAARATLQEMLLRATLVLEGNAELRAVGDGVSRTDIEVLLDDLSDAEAPKAFTCLLHGGRCRIFPGLLTGTDELDDLVNTHALNLQ
jgi:hypothetical protein